MPALAPKIDAILSSDRAGSFGLGAALTLILDASEGLKVDTTAGTPSLHLSNGAIAIYDAMASAAAGADKLAFTYIVGVGENTSDLHVSTLELNGATIVGQPSVVGFAVTSTFPSGPSGSLSYNISVGDIDADGKLDIITSNIYGGMIFVLKGDGTGSFATPQSFAAGDKPRGVAIGDVNGDSKLDLVVGGERLTGTISVLLGDGTGSFAAPKFVTGIPGTYTNGVALADVTGDGKLDIITAGSNRRIGAVLAGDGTGNFAAPQTFQGSVDMRGLAVADVTSDGKPDIITAETIFGPILVLAGLGAGNFAAPKIVGSLGGVTGLAVSDVTGDGKLDIVAGSEYWGTGVKALAGDGTGGFGAPQAAGGLGGFAGPDGLRAVGVAIADVTADGLVDILAVGTGGITVLAAQAGGPGLALDLSSVFTADNISLVVDASAPTLTGFSVTVSGVTTSNLLHAGDTAVVTMFLNEAVELSVGGEAVLTLSNGAVLSGGAVGEDGRSLVFQYEVSAADGTRELKVSGLTLGTGTTLRDMAGNDVVLTDVAGDLGVAVDHQTSGAPAVAGTATRSEVLVASVGTLVDSDGFVTLTYHWERDDGNGGWTSISGAEGSSYALVREDIGHAVRVAARFVDELGVSGTTFSEASAVVAPRAVPIAPPTDGLSDTRVLTYQEVQARVADGDMLAPPAGTEEVRLADGTLSFGSGTDAAFVTRLYGGVLGRKADASGLTSWSGGPGADVDRVEVARGFLTSVEYQLHHGEQTDSQFVETTYQELLLRDVEAEGASFWYGQMAAGASREQVLAGIANSTEAQQAWSGATASGVFVVDANAGLIRATYQAAFGRDAEAGGLVHFSDLLRVGMSLDDFGNYMEASNEFLVVHGTQTDAEYVQSLYVNALGRLPGQGEGAAWELQLASGAEDRSDVLLHFVNSDEGRQHLDWAI